MVSLSTGLRRMATVTVALLALFDGMGPGQVGRGCARNGANASRDRLVRGFGGWDGLFVDPFSGGLGGIVRLAGLEEDFARRFWFVSDCKGGKLAASSGRRSFFC